MSVDKFESLLSTRRPYYILAPDYIRASAGIRVLHLLCHLLNRSGEEAYVTTGVTNPSLQTPLLTAEIKARHQQANARPIAVYPEIVFGNPLGLRSIVRYILNHPGLINGPTTFDDSDLLFFFNTEYASTFPHIPLRELQIPVVNTSVFNNGNNPADKGRTGILIYPGRYDEAATLYPDLFRDGTVITQDWPATHPELAKLLRTSERLYCFTNSAIALEAVLCGCPVILMDSPFNAVLLEQYRSKSPTDRPPGGAVEDTESELARARASITDAINIQRGIESRSLNQLAEFISLTQALPDNAVASDSDVNLTNWSSQGTGSLEQENLADLWLQQRAAQNADSYLQAGQMAAAWRRQPSFHIIVRHEAASGNALANTIDGLGQQFHTSWHLDVISDMPIPEGIDEIPCIDWHTTEDAGQDKDTIDALVLTRQCDWIIELPPGAVLDPLYLWRMSEETNHQPELAALFVDDYITDEQGIGQQLRLKPGVNIEYLQSSDLAGPVCVRQDIWQLAGGASKRRGSPWFSLLLHVADIAGWPSVKHVPDTLIGYRETLGNNQSCLLALMEHLQDKGIIGEIVPATGQSWCIRYPLNTTPAVTIAILSEGHLELLSRCLDSIIEKTSYPNFEIIIALTEATNDPEIEEWLQSRKQRSSLPLRVIRTSSSGNHASRCNAAVQASSSDFVLLIREEAIALEGNWLEELVRSCLQPGIAAVSPRLMSTGSGFVANAGYVFGLTELAGTPYLNAGSFSTNGYLDCMKVARDVSALASICILLRKMAYLATGGMDETELGDYLADVDLCQKLRKQSCRLIYQPLTTIGFSGMATLDIHGEIEQQARASLARAHAAKILKQRWPHETAVDPFWNPNLSLASSTPRPETSFSAQWQHVPSPVPRILARPLPNSQGVIRISSPLRALRNAGLAAECIWPREGSREPSLGELLRLAPDSLIVQHYINDDSLSALTACHASSHRPFTVYSLDDLLTDMAESNPFRKNIPANSRTRLKYALSHCDRLVTSTQFLANTYRHLIADIRVVPNRLEQEVWLPLQSRRRTTDKPRIGWAGGTTHQGDLILLKEIVEQTMHEADWVFFGMCPDEIRPLLAEYHNLVNPQEYPAYLAALNLDIAVAPLAEIPFNQGKSNLRLLEYGVLGIPVICTDIDPYQGSPACCVKNTVNAWVAALRERIHDADAREREGQAIRQWVYQHYLLENHLEEWLAAHLPRGK